MYVATLYMAAKIRVKGETKQCQDLMDEGDGSAWQKIEPLANNKQEFIQQCLISHKK